jgi:hypothetical protein
MLLLRKAERKEGKYAFHNDSFGNFVPAKKEGHFPFANAQVERQSTFSLLLLEGKRQQQHQDYDTNRRFRVRDNSSVTLTVVEDPRRREDDFAHVIDQV